MLCAVASARAAGGSIVCCCLSFKGIKSLWDDMGALLWLYVEALEKNASEDSVKVKTQYT